MADTIRVQFASSSGKPGHVEGVPGTNFGLRLTNDEVERLELDYGIDNLPFYVMAAGYGEDEDWVALTSGDMHEDYDDDSSPIDVWHEKWAPYEISRHDAPWALTATADLPSLFTITYLTPEEALGAIQSRLEAFESHVGNDGMSPEMLVAIDVLHGFITKVREHGSEDLEWGEPGDCWERIVNDDDILEAFAEEHGSMPDLSDDTTRDAVADWAKSRGLGRHYGDPHCIWCLQAS